jgi:DUF1680 family protein
MSASAHASAPPGEPAETEVAAPVVPARARLRALGLGQISLAGGFWGDRQEVNSTATLAHIEHWLEREGWLGNFDLVASGADMSQRRGREFSDSEIYKVLEAMAWELGRRPDPGLEQRYARIAARVVAAQDLDGYINTQFGHGDQAPRYSDLEWGHELYCQGHLYQAAVARVRTGHPDDQLVQVARRSADHVCAAFGPDGIQGVCGHAEIEVGLAELGRALREPRYVEQAALFVTRRGTGTLADIEFGRAYYQDDMPVRDADVFRGHAVRANYLAAGAVDVAVETADHELLAAVAMQWRNTRARRTYVTGGQGSRHQDEGFGDDFMLPPDRAYSETCAAIASTMVAWRLLLQTGESQYADAMERTLYNVVATSPAEDGKAFYYANTLHQRVPGEPAEPEVASARAESSLRAPWFEVSCCPPNVARTLASLAAYVATADASGVQVHQYAAGEIAATLDGGERLRLKVDTDYPRSGRVVFTVVEAPVSPWQLSLRIPEWATGGATVTVDGGADRIVRPGYVAVDGPSRAGGEVVLELDMTPRVLMADPRVDAVRGCVVVERGPEVYCLESIDLPGGGNQTEVSRLRLQTGVAPRYEDGRLVVSARVLPAGRDADWPYTDDMLAGSDHLGEIVEIPLIPYHDWARRGPSTMRVWIPGE